MLFLAGLLWLCFSVFEAEAYDQQYSVGDTGPNGGTITSVDVTSTLQDTSTQIIGGFEETTEQWQFIETITEQVNSVQTVTTYEQVETQVVQEKTTDNLVCTNGSCDVMGSTSGGISAVGDGYVFSYQGGTLSGTVDLADSMTQDEFNLGFNAQASVDTFTCLNTIGSNTSCDDVGNPTADTLKITITVTDGIETYTNTATHTINWSPSNGLETVYGYLTVPENSLQDYATATLSVYGIDNGFWGGYYGPYITNPSMTFTFDEITYIQQLVERQIEQTVVNYINTEYFTTEYIVDSTYIGDPTMDAVSLPPVQMDTPPVIEIKAVSNDTFTVEVKVDTPAGPKTEVMDIKVSDMKIEKIEPMEGNSNEPIRTVEAGNTSEGKAEGGGDTKASAKGSKSSNKKGTNSGNTATYNTVMESVKLAVMAQSTSLESFNAYKQVSLPTVEFYPVYEVNGGQVYDNPYGMWWTGAADVLWNEMVELQWRN